MPKPAARPLLTPVDALTSDLLPDTRAVFSELRSLIATTLPAATEKVRLARKSLNFSHPNVGYFCGLHPVDGHVTLEFEFGVLLPDPNRILIANSCAKQVRYMRIRSVETLPRAALKRLLRAAISLPREHSTRMALIRTGAKLVPPKPSRRKRGPS